MSALHLKADMCGATRDVCFGPIADAKAFTNAETTNLYLGFRSLGCVSTKISSDNRTETQLVSMKTDTPTAKWPAAGSKSIPSATISKKIAVSAWMEKYNLAITGNGASVTTRLISGQDTVKTAIKIAAVKLETRHMAGADSLKSASNGGSSAEMMTIRLLTKADQIRNASYLVRWPPTICRNAAISAAKPANVTEIMVRL